MEQKYHKIRGIIDNLSVDMHKFIFQKNKSAGIRLRKGLQEVKELATEIRKEILDTKKL